MKEVRDFGDGYTIFQTNLEGLKDFDPAAPQHGEAR